MKNRPYLMREEPTRLLPRRMIMNLLAPAWALAMLALGGCSEPHACTLVGAVSGVRVTGGTAGVPLRLCSGRDCATTRLDASGAGFVPLSSLQEGRAVNLDATYSGPRSPVVSRVKILPTKVQPNGPGCEPTVAVAQIALDPTGRARG